MRIFITGPSCSGKTTFASRFDGVTVISLDSASKSMKGILHLLPNDKSDIVIIEGLPFGKSDTAREFLELCDLVFLLDVPFYTRIYRSYKRDGLGGFPRWLYNEVSWLLFCRSLIASCSTVTHFADSR